MLWPVVTSVPAHLIHAEVRRLGVTHVLVVPDKHQRTLIASLSNFVFKGVMVAVLGGRRLFRYLAPAFGLAVLAGLGVLFWWPADLGPHP